MTVNIPHEYLNHLYNLKQDGKLTEYSYVDVVSALLSQNAIELKPDCKRNNGILCRYCAEIRSKSPSLQGNARTEYLSKSKCISVYEKEISRVSEVKEELSTASAVLDTLSKENGNLQKRYELLSKEMGRLQGSIKQNEKELVCERELSRRAK